MADIGTGLRQAAIAKAAISAIVGSRVYPDRLPQSAMLPAIVYQVISGEREHGLGGDIQATAARVQFDCIAATRLAANALADAVKDWIEPACGSAQLRGWCGSVWVYEATVAGGVRYDAYQQDVGSDEHYYVASLDALVSFFDD